MKNLKEKMKKMYFSPEAEGLLLNLTQPLLAGSEKEDITDGSIKIIDDPSDEDLDW